MSPGITHRSFGFHDVAAWGRRTDSIACLQVAVIDRPPVVGDQALVGRYDPSMGVFTPCDQTAAFNFPQGARHLWDREGKGYRFNCRNGDRWGGSYLKDDGTAGPSIDHALYALSPSGLVGFGLNFARLNRLGGYGYAGLPDLTASQRPADDGIVEVGLETGIPRTLVSIADVAAPVNTDPGGTHHYLTHVVPNPSGSPSLFLHRWWLPDGGIGSRLVSSATDGKDIRCHAGELLSNFDWWDDHRLIIWGRLASKPDQLRRLPGTQCLRWALKDVKSVVRVARRSVAAGRISFLLIDIPDMPVQPFWPDLLIEDGRPMFCPAGRDWLSVDTYHDAKRVGQLILLHQTTGQLVDLGRNQFADLPLGQSLLHKVVRTRRPCRPLQRRCREVRVGSKRVALRSASKVEAR